MSDSPEYVEFGTFPRCFLRKKAEVLPPHFDGKGAKCENRVGFLVEPVVTDDEGGVLYQCSFCGQKVFASPTGICT